MTEEIKKKYEEYLSSPLIKELNLNDQEIDRYLNLIIKIVDEQNMCNKLPNDTCINRDFSHLRLVRDEKGHIKIISVPCNKKKAHNLWVIKDFSIEKDEKVSLFFLKDDPMIDPQSNKKIIINEKLKPAGLDLINNKDVGNKGLFIYGEFGIGKTYLMACFGNSVVRNNKSVALVNMAKLVQKIKTNFDSNTMANKKIIDKISQVDVLILDDLGSEKASAWFYNQYLFNILEYRCNNRLLTFFTSNYDLTHYGYEMKRGKDMNEKDVKRITERIRMLCGNCEIELKDHNYRY